MAKERGLPGKTMSKPATAADIVSRLIIEYQSALAEVKRLTKREDARERRLAKLEREIAALKRKAAA